MKSKLYLVLLLIPVFSISIGQTISNSGFENWSVQDFYEEPDFYATTNFASFTTAGIPNVIKTTDAISGNYAIKCETINTTEGPISGAAFIGSIGMEGVAGGLPFTERPDSLKGFAKYNVVGQDTAYVAVLFKLFGAPLGICFIQFIGTQNSYEAFSAPVQWLIPIISPDTIAIGVTSSTIFGAPEPGSTITVDNLTFVGDDAVFPNGDFEDWTDYSSEEPEDWFTSNLLSFYTGQTPVTKTTDSYEGDYAIQLESSLTFWGDTLAFITNGTFGDEGPEGGMPVDSVPDKLSGYYKYEPVGPDTAVAAVTLYYHNPNSGNTSMLEESWIQLLPTSTYTYFEIPVDYFALPEPDTVNIAFASSNLDFENGYIGLGSTLYIDALEMTYKEHITSVNTKDINSEHNFYPNPASEKVFIDLYSLINQEVDVRIMDSYGRIVYQSNEKIEGNQTFNFDVADFEAGVYFYMIENGSKIYKGKFIVK
ncbi:MAG: T9SS type A sorting domain-containing protein [Bacteroidales bacterium]|nr:T9SS type A sorting domain-containing protein [Bacteroidales bacterium]